MMPAHLAPAAGSVPVIRLHCVENSLARPVSLGSVLTSCCLQISEFSITLQQQTFVQWAKAKSMRYTLKDSYRPKSRVASTHLQEKIAFPQKLVESFTDAFTGTEGTHFTRIQSQIHVNVVRVEAHRAACRPPRVKADNRNQVFHDWLKWEKRTYRYVEVLHKAKGCIMVGCPLMVSVEYMSAIDDVLRDHRIGSQTFKIRIRIGRYARWT